MALAAGCLAGCSGMDEEEEEAVWERRRVLFRCGDRCEREVSMASNSALMLARLRADSMEESWLEDASETVLKSTARRAKGERTREFKGQVASHDKGWHGNWHGRGWHGKGWSRQ